MEPEPPAIPPDVWALVATDAMLMAQGGEVGSASDDPLRRRYEELLVAAGRMRAAIQTRDEG